MVKKTGLLALEDGTVFWGESVGKEGLNVGELVFNTAMTGYQEILTDPSYAGQIICFTFPHIGIVGVNEEDNESDRVWTLGAVMRECTHYKGHWRASGDLQTFFQKQGLIALSGIDTRKLTHILRSKGSQRACIMGGKVDPALALLAARSSLISAEVPSTLRTWEAIDACFHVVVLDFGIKNTLLDYLHLAGCRITQLAKDTTADEILKRNPDGVLISNGPGDPTSYSDAIEIIRELLDRRIPLFGVCLGHQLLGLASGAKIGKMKHGHHGANHPVLEVASGKVFISCQNHSYAIEEKDLPSCLQVTHRSLFDGSIAGMCRRDRPALGFQGHPEGGPGPHELQVLFKQFITMMEGASCPKEMSFTKSF